MFRIGHRILSSLFLALTCIYLQPVTAQALSAGSLALPGSMDKSVRGQLRAIEFTTLSAGLSGRLSRFDVRPGQQVRAKQTLAQFDCRSERTERTVAEGKLTAAQAKMEVNQRLAELKNISGLELSLSKAALSIAQAELRRIDTLLSHCVVQAPFAGVITAKPVQAHQFVAKGGPLLDMINTTKLEVEMILPSRWLVEIRPGTRFSLLVDETGSRVDARVDRIVSQVDPVSQTVRVIGVLLDPPTPDLLPGMSGNIHFLTDQVVPAR